MKDNISIENEGKFYLSKYVTWTLLLAIIFYLITALWQDFFKENDLLTVSIIFILISINYFFISVSLNAYYVLNRFKENDLLIIKSDVLIPIINFKYTQIGKEVGDIGKALKGSYQKSSFFNDIIKLFRFLFNYLLFFFTVWFAIIYYISNKNIYK